jgi:HlyD family secretion protein
MRLVLWMSRLKAWTVRFWSNCNLLARVPAGLRQGQRLPTKVVLERHPNVLKVQRGPFVEESGGEFAYVVEGNRAVRRPIRIGAISSDEVEITDGLHSGEALVVAGVRNVSTAEIRLIP